MEKENQSIRDSLIKGFGLKKIVLLLIFIFILFLAYKYISSNIQENKEKAIIQEREKVQQQKEYEEKEARAKLKSDLDFCISMAESDYDFNWAAKCKEYAKKLVDQIAWCRKANFRDIVCESIGSPDASSNCALPPDWIDSLRDWLKERKDECYKRYK